MCQELICLLACDERTEERVADFLSPCFGSAAQRGGGCPLGYARLKSGASSEFSCAVHARCLIAADICAP